MKKYGIILTIALAATGFALIAFGRGESTIEPHAQYSTLVSSNSSTLVMSNRCGMLRLTGFIVNNGPSDGWVSRISSTTSNGELLIKGAKYAIQPPTIANGVWYGTDCNEVYFWSTGNVTVAAEEGISQ